MVKTENKLAHTEQLRVQVHLRLLTIRLHSVNALADNWFFTLHAHKTTWNVTLSVYGSLIRHAIYEMWVGRSIVLCSYYAPGWIL